MPRPSAITVRQADQPCAWSSQSGLRKGSWHGRCRVPAILTLISEKCRDFNLGFVTTLHWVIPSGEASGVTGMFEASLITWQGISTTQLWLPKCLQTLSYVTQGRGSTSHLEKLVEKKLNR